MKSLIKEIKSNNGFTLQDVVIGMVIMVLFAGSIAATYISVYKIQSETKLSSVAAIYGIQILENIDKIAYEKVTNDMEDEYRKSYKIPNTMDLKIEVSKYNEEDTIKQVKLTIKYQFAGKEETLLLEKFKAKET